MASDPAGGYSWFLFNLLDNIPSSSCPEYSFHAFFPGVIVCHGEFCNVAFWMFEGCFVEVGHEGGVLSIVVVLNSSRGRLQSGLITCENNTRADNTVRIDDTVFEYNGYKDVSGVTSYKEVSEVTSICFEIVFVYSLYRYRK